MAPFLSRLGTLLTLSPCSEFERVTPRGFAILLGFISILGFASFLALRDVDDGILHIRASTVSLEQEPFLFFLYLFFILIPAVLAALLVYWTLRAISRRLRGLPGGLSFEREPGWYRYRRKTTALPRLWTRSRHPDSASIAGPLDKGTGRL